MERGTTFFLKITVYLIGLIVLILSVGFLPWMASDTASTYPEYAHLQYPVLIGLYLTAIPFFFSLYQALKLLHHIDHQKAFSLRSVKVLNHIKSCAVIIASLYVIGSVFLFAQNALHPGIALVGLAIIGTTIVLAVFTAVLQMLLEEALEIKSENELTV